MSILPVTVALTLSGCGTGDGPSSTAADYHIGSFWSWPSRINDEVVTASASASDDRLVLGTSAGHVYEVEVDRFTSAAQDDEYRSYATLAGKVLTVFLSADGATVGAISNYDDMAWGDWGEEMFVVRGDGPAESAAVNNAMRYVYPDRAIAVDHGGTRIAFALFDIQVFDLTTRRLLATLKQEEDADVLGDLGAVSFTVEGDTVVAIAGGTVLTWDLASPGQPRGSVTCGCPVASGSLSAEGERAAFGTADGHLIVLDAGTGAFLLDRTVDTVARNSVSAVAVSPDGRLAVGVSGKGKGMIWDGTVGDLGEVVWRGAVEGSSAEQWSFDWRSNVPARQPLRAHLDGEGGLLLERMTRDEDEGTGFGLQPLWTDLEIA